MKEFLSIVVLSIFLFAPCPASAQSETSKPFGWDLTYAALFEKYNVEPKSSLRTWMSHYNYGGYISQTVKAWEDEPIVGSILLEFPVLYSTNKNGFWFVRTRRGAFFWHFRPTAPFIREPSRFDGSIYDKLGKQLSSFDQSKPMVHREGFPPGFYGLLSVYNEGHSRQILLTLDDIYRFRSQGNYSVEAGRVASALDRVFTRISAQSALIFRRCGDRVKKKDLESMYGEPIACFPVQRGESNDGICFRAHSAYIRARFDKKDRITHAHFSSYESYEIARLMPAASWIRSRTTHRNSPFIIDPVALHQPYTDSFFDDDCLSIHKRIFNTHTALIQGWTQVTWRRAGPKKK